MKCIVSNGRSIKYRAKKDDPQVKATAGDEIDLPAPIAKKAIALGAVKPAGAKQEG